MGSVRKARRVVCSTSFLCAGTLLVISTTIRDPWLKMIAIGFASFCNDVVLPPAWGACMDVGGKFSGTLSGAMNMTGNFGGVVFPVVTAYVLAHFGNNWNYGVLLVRDLVHFCGRAMDEAGPGYASGTTRAGAAISVGRRLMRYVDLRSGFGAQTGVRFFDLNDLASVEGDEDDLAGRVSVDPILDFITILSFA